MAMAVTKKCVYSEPEVLAPESDHRSISPLFLVRLQAGTRLFWTPVCLSCRAVIISHKILAVINIVSSEGNIGKLLWISWLNLTNNILWPLPLLIEVSESVFTVM